MKKIKLLKSMIIVTVLVTTMAVGSCFATTPPNSDPNASTVATKFVNVSGKRIAYRRFGKKSTYPLIFTNYLTGSMDNWDPAVINELAKDREVILFDNAGVAASKGQTPDNVAAMAKDAADFIHALGLKKIDLFGFSIGGMVAQQLTLDQPELIHRLILVGTGPRGGEGMQDYTPEVWALFQKKYEHAYELLLETFFTPSEASQKAGRAYLSRIRARVDKDAALSDKVVPAQLAAIFSWGKMPSGNYEYLKRITQPVLVIHGDKDIICPAVNSFILKQHLPDAQLIIYPDTNHSPQNQMPHLFVKQINLFLAGVK
jgi:pimeloyl-ACP methyl ester carboxylesterase